MSITRRRFVTSSVLLASTAAGRLAFPMSAQAACPPPVLIAPKNITRLEVETWTGTGENDRTGDPFQCRIVFADGRSFSQVLDNPNINDRELGQRDRFRLNLNAPQAAAAISGQGPNSIRALEIRKTGGTNLWRCVAVGLRVNNVVVLSRYVTNGALNTTGQSFRVDLRTDGGLDGVELLIRTANSPKGATDDAVFANVVFTDGTLLYPNENVLLNVGGHLNDFERNNSISNYAYLLPLPADGNIARTAANIDHFYLRKEGTNGWLLRSARLYANGSPNFFVGNSAINQFLDNSKHALGHSDWSSRSLLRPVTTPANLPLPANAQYAISGPVLGHVGANSAKVLYRVEREGTYRVTLTRADMPSDVHTIEMRLCPTGTFAFSGLTPDKDYRFEFFRLVSGKPLAMPEGNGTLHTRPADGTPVRFSFVAGSCARNSYDDEQPVWNMIAQSATNKDPTRFFVHLGDSTYFFDDVTESPASDESTLAAGFFAPRKHPGFLLMARALPCYAVWDDHDFRYNNATALGYNLKATALRLFRDYWGNPDPLHAQYGLTSRFSYGNVDFYLMDGRYNRNPLVGAAFTTAQCNFILGDIKSRGPGRMRILMTGSLWNNTKVDTTQSAYGNAVYNAERQAFYQGLAALLGSQIEGLVFLSGDVHVNEIYEVSLPAAGTKVAPEIVCSPLTKTSSGSQRPLTDERKWAGAVSQPSFAVIQVDTTASPWTLRVQFRKVDGTPVCTQSYALQNSQFPFAAANAQC